VKACEVLLDHGANIDAKGGKGGLTALMHAIAHSQPEAARLLVARGANVLLRCGEGHRTAGGLAEEKKRESPAMKSLAKLLHREVREVHKATKEVCGVCVG
jgi:ankyrin repeat protein